MSNEQRTSFSVHFYEIMQRAIQRIVSPRAKALPTNNVRYNIVVVGKTGVGKTQLINYLIGQEVLKTGIGSPITQLGFHRTDLVLSGINTSIWDSAGLEVGRHEQWMLYLHNELRERNLTAPVSKWFHTVLYCIQGSGSRIEPFEIEIIKRFDDERYRIIIVITKAFISKRKLDELSQAVRKAFPKPLVCVYVNSRDEEISDFVVNSYGKADLVREIQVTLIESLTDRIPLRCVRFMEKYLDEEYAAIIQNIQQSLNRESYKSIAHRVTSRLNSLAEDVKSPHGKFHEIILRETRITLGVYQEIAGLVEHAMTAAMDSAVAATNSSAFNVTAPTGFWTTFEATIDEFYDWDLKKSWGKVVDTTAKVAMLPIALVVSALGGAIAFIADHLQWEKEASKKVSSYISDLKAQLADSEAGIRQLIYDEIRRI